MADQQGHELDQLAHRSVALAAAANGLLDSGNHQQAGDTALVALADAVAMFAVMLADEQAERRAERRAEEAKPKVCHACRDYGTCSNCGRDL